MTEPSVTTAYLTPLFRISDGWQAALPPAQEAARLEALASYRILDTAPTASFDRITALLRQEMGVAMALVSLVDANRQWFKSACGIDAHETPRDMAFCSHAIHADVPFIVPDATLDERFRGNPLVTGAPHIRFYAGVPLISPKGYRLGTLCAIDTKPRATLSLDELTLLQSLSEMVVDAMELHRANVMLEEQLQLRSEFLAVMSHEIRTPMHGVMGMASLLAEAGLPDKLRRYVSMIQQSADSMMELVNDMLDLSKIEAGKIRIESARIDMVQLIKDAISLVKPSADGKGIDLRLAYPPEVICFAFGDALRIRQVLLNLLTNAIKFTDEGQVQVSLRAHECADQDATVCFEIDVEDSGIGIAPEDQQRIFVGFEQADMSATRRYQGTGLGLAICRQLCALMGGSIALQSELGKGSCFTVSLCLAKDPVRHGLVHVSHIPDNDLNYNV